MIRGRIYRESNLPDRFEVIENDRTGILIRWITGPEAGKTALYQVGSAFIQRCIEVKDTCSKS